MVVATTTVVSPPGAGIVLDALTEEVNRRAVIVRHMHELEALAFAAARHGDIVRQKHFVAALERALERLRVLDHREG